MPQVDLPLAQLQEYRPGLTREPDFDAFWEATLNEAAGIALDVEVAPVTDYPVPGLRLARVYYTGWGGARLCAWWIVPPDSAPGAGADGRRPTMIFYHGYGGSKGGADLYLGWACKATASWRWTPGGSPGTAPTPWRTPAATPAAT
jgi:cephalosporin-C deacetylase